jgi:hypothetical protein
MPIGRCMHAGLAALLITAACDAPKPDDRDTAGIPDPTSTSTSTTPTDTQPTDTGTAGPLQDITALLMPITAGTAWAELDPAVQQALEAHADQVLADHRAEWDAAGLAAKEAVVLADSGAIEAQVGTYVANQLGLTVVLADVEPALELELRRLYLAHVGASRSVLLWNGILYADWDASGPLVGAPLPDPVALEDLQAYAAGVATSLEALLDAGTLSDADRVLAARALLLSRSLRTGSVGQFGYGADDLRAPASLAVFAPQPVIDHRFLGAYPDDETFLRAFNGMLLGADLRYVSAHTASVATDLTGNLFGPLGAFVADPETARMVDLLWAWWFERLVALPAASEVCYAYTDAERARIVDATTADLLLPEDPAWLDTLDARTDVEGAALAGAYQQAMLEALAALGDDLELPPDVLAAAEDAVRAEPGFGALVETATDALTAASGGDPEAADALLNRLAQVTVVGGDPTAVDPAHDRLVQMAWTDLRAELVARYETGARPLSIGALLPMSVTTDVGTGASTDGYGGISVGLGDPVDLATVHLLLVHEALHAIGARAGLFVNGASFEGAGALAEHTVGREVLAALVPSDDLPLWLLAVADTDARRWGISDATVAVLEADCASGVDTADLAVATARAWGATGAALDDARVRGHFGSQYLASLGGQFAYADTVAWFEDQVEPGVDNGIDPFDLVTCGFPTPAHTADEVAALAVCLGLGG